jgi:hypothetical protein
VMLGMRVLCRRRSPRSSARSRATSAARPRPSSSR